MKKKSAVALAVGAVFAAPVMAQTTTGSTVQIYGKLYPELTWFKSSGATPPGGVTSNLAPQATPNGTNSVACPAPCATDSQNHKQRLSVDVANSYLGFRGEEKLGGSLAAIWQVEQSLGFDTGNTDVFATRNSFLGLRSGFGTVKLGNMDTIYKEYGDQFSMFGIGSGNIISASNTLSQAGVGAARSARFHERFANSIQYETPQFADVTLGVQYATDDLKGNPGRTVDVKVWSYGVKYESERVYVSLQQEQHYDMFGGSNNAAAGVANPTGTGTAASSRDTATRLSATFKLSENHKIAGDVARLEYKERGQAAAGLFEKLEKTNWAVGWEARWGGPVRTGVQYVKSNEGSCALSGGVACSTSGLDGSQVNLGVAYDMSKRTFLFGLFAKLTNGESALFDNWANGTVARGADITQFAVGVSHSF